MNTPRVEFKLSEEAKQNVRAFTQNSRDFRQKANRLVRTLAEETAKTVVRVIEQQEFAPLAVSPQWTARKRKLGLDPRTLIATQDYIKSIRAKKVSDGVWTVQADALKSEVLEYGNPRDAKPTPRPHWRLAIAEMERRSPGIVDAFVLGLLEGGQ